MSDSKKPTSTARRYRYWAIVLPVTLVLVYPVYRAWTNVSQAERVLAKALADEERVRREHDRWSQLAAEQNELRSHTGIRKRDIAAAMKSFSRDELRDALRRAVEAADPEEAIVLQTQGTLWGTSVWVWVPEPDHQLVVQLEAVNLEEEDVVDGLPSFDQDLKLDLAPRQFQLIQFSIEERHKSQDCVVRLRFNEQVILEETMLLDPNSSTSRGGSSESVLVRPRVVSPSWTWSDAPYQLYQQGIWYRLKGRQFGLRPRRGEDGDTRRVKISLDLGIACGETLYAPKSTIHRLKKVGIQAVEVDDVASEFHGLLQLTGATAGDSAR